MQARGVEVDNSSLNRWVLKYTPALDQTFGQRKRLVGTNWRTATGLGLPRRPAPWTRSICASKVNGNTCIERSTKQAERLTSS